MNTQLLILKNKIRRLQSINRGIREVSLHWHTDWYRSKCALDMMCKFMNIVNGDEDTCICTKNISLYEFQSYLTGIISNENIEL